MVNISNASPEQINSSLCQTQATFARRRREKMQIFRLKIHPLWVDWTFVGWAARSGIRSPAYVPTPTWSALPIFTLHTAFVPTWNGRYTTIISVLLIEKFQRTEPRTASTVNRQPSSNVLRLLSDQQEFASHVLMVPILAFQPDFGSKFKWHKNSNKFSSWWCKDVQ